MKDTSIGSLDTRTSEVYGEALGNTQVVLRDKSKLPTVLATNVTFSVCFQRQISWTWCGFVLCTNQLSVNISVTFPGIFISLLQRFNCILYFYIFDCRYASKAIGGFSPANGITTCDLTCLYRFVILLVLLCCDTQGDWHSFINMLVWLLLLTLCITFIDAVYYIYWRCVSQIILIYTSDVHCLTCNRV